MKKQSMFLVAVKGKSVFTTSEVVSDGCEKLHKNTLGLIRRYKTDFEELGTLAFETRKSGGIPVEYAIMNEDQATYLITLFRNNEIVRRFKLELVKAFRRALNELQHLRAMRDTPEWQQARIEGKVQRLEETDVIKEFIDYARARGSEHADWYYKSFTAGIYKALFVLEQGGKWTGLRDRLPAPDLNTLATAERIAQKYIREGMMLGMEYKAIYKYAIAKVEDFVEIMGQARIPAAQANILKLTGRATTGTY